MEHHTSQYNAWLMEKSVVVLARTASSILYAETTQRQAAHKTERKTGTPRTKSNEES